MTDIKLIEVVDDVIKLNPSFMSEKLSDKEEALQYITIAILNTQGTMIDDVDFGGGADALIRKLKTNFSQNSEEAAEVVHNANVTIKKHNPDFGRYSINNITLKSVERDTPRSYIINIRVNFSDARPEDFILEG